LEDEKDIGDVENELMIEMSDILLLRPVLQNVFLIS